MEFNDLAIVPINNSGVWVESSYEREAYNFLIEENINFYKPYESDSDFLGMIPDAMILGGKKKIIFEVFGRSESDEYYHKRKETKIKHFKSLTKYDFVCWKAYKEESLNEPINKIKELLNE